MAWRIELTETAARTLAKLHRPVARRITEFLWEKPAHLDDPRSAGEALVGPLSLWRYRAGDFRIAVSIEAAALRIPVIRTGHRREVYR